MPFQTNETNSTSFDGYREFKCDLAPESGIDAPVM